MGINGLVEWAIKNAEYNGNPTPEGLLASVRESFDTEELFGFLRGYAPKEVIDAALVAAANNAWNNRR